MARTKIPKIKVPGTGSIPSGFMLGRVSPGVGDVELLTHDRIAHALVATGVVSAPGDVSIAPIATTTTIGSVKPDTVTIKVDANGVISVILTGIGSALNGMLPLVTGDTTPGGQPFFITDGIGQCIGVPL